MLSEAAVCTAQYEASQKQFSILFMAIIKISLSIMLGDMTFLQTDSYYLL